MSQNLPDNSKDRHVQGTSSDDILHGTDRDDVIFGYSGNDVITGGKGNDTLYGGKGNDFYIYHPGDGYDRIEDEEGTDTLILKEIWRNEVTLKLREDGFHIVFYKGEPIVEMRGVDYVQTEDGCWSVERQWGL
ncbi:hypothetical protein V2H45_11870 [Tumidithrix elongata RA019]|uniref:Alkaline phosphatase n=1 Tax=Tumidithrix elongata BACA0141 TaxID=2716417 RepID=A0AAW9Q2J3_9CYAN|nr:hypothetical protein [Tumidithrix elongata RA019]